MLGLSVYVELDIHFVREKAIAWQIVVQHISSKDQVADGFTKALSKNVFANFRSKLMVFPSNTISLRGDISDMNELAKSS